MPTEQEYQKYIREIEGSLDEERQRSMDLSKANYGQMNLFNQENEQNLIQWQLDMREDLDRIYHLLQGHILKDDEEGNIVYIEPINPNLKPFNEFGVQIIMNIMAFYLNRNTILSNYDEQTINWKVLDFGYDLADLIFNRYDEMMITIETEDEELIKEHLANKVKLFPMIHRELCDTIHSAYLRAYHGGERESLRTARTVTQNEPLTRGNPQMQVINPQKKFRIWNPRTWS